MLRIGVVFEFIGSRVLIMVRKIVKDRNMVIVYDIFFLVFMGRVKIKMVSIFRKRIGMMMLNI